MELIWANIKEALFINSQNHARVKDQKKILNLEKGLDLDPIWSGSEYARVYLHVCFAVGFLNDETWLNVGSKDLDEGTIVCRSVGDTL